MICTAVFQVRPKWSERLHLKRVGKITNRKIIMTCEVHVVTLCITKFNTHKIYILLTQFIYVLCMDLKNKQQLFRYAALVHKEAINWNIQGERSREREREREKRWTKWKTATQQYVLTEGETRNGIKNLVRIWV